MMTKQEAVDAIYAIEGRTFDYDGALPSHEVDHIVNILMQTPLKKDYEWYAILAGGCVYAYCKLSDMQGFLPITQEARLALFEFEHLSKSSVTFNPVAF